MIHCKYEKLVPINDIILNKDNRNRHPKDQIERLAQLIEHYGCRHPIIISSIDQTVVAGEGRYLSMKKLGWKEVPVDVQQFANRDEQIAFGISDNAINLWSELDFSGINADMCAIGPFDIELLGVKDWVIDPVDKPKKEKKSDDIECPGCGLIIKK